MPRYIYSAKTDPHNIIQGEIEAESSQEAISKLTRMGYFPIDVRSSLVYLDKQGSLAIKKINHKEVVLFTGQLASLVDSGVNILSSLNIIINQTGNKYLRSVLSDVISKIKDGSSLSVSLSAYPRVFSGLYTALIATGEATGKINDSLKKLAEFMDKEEEFRNSLRSSLAYPAFVLFVGAMTVVALLVFVIPRLVTMFEDMGQALPLPTQILINTSNFMRSYWLAIIIAIIVSVFLIRRALATKQGKAVWDEYKLKVFILGDINLKTEISRLMRTLSLLLSSGVPITSSLEVSSAVVENLILKAEVQKFKSSIADGSSLTAAFKISKLFPEFVINIVAIGEEAGSLDKSLMRIAEDYEKEIDRKLKTLSRLLEPVIILVMGLIVGFIVMSMLLPIFQINLIAQ